MRIRDFQKHLKDKRLSAAVFFNFEEYANPHYLYFSQFEGYGALLIPQKGKARLFVPEMEAERARKTGNTVIVTKKKGLFKLLKKYCRGKHIGIDKGAVSLNFYRFLKKELKRKKFHDVSKAAKCLRVVKTKKEIGYLKKACRISDNILEKCFRNFKKFKTELDVANFLEQEARKKGCSLSFPVIVASGKHASMPHYKPRKVKLQKGFCVIDFGVKYKNYCSDCTRTIYLGKPSQKEKELYNHVLQAQLAVTKFMKPGINCGKVFDTSITELGKYAKYFTHGLGHGVGVEIHELPNLTSKSKDVLLEHVVVTNEPGIYLPGKLGIRIEDTILITKQGARVLTRVGKRLKVL